MNSPALSQAVSLVVRDHTEPELNLLDLVARALLASRKIDPPKPANPSEADRGDAEWQCVETWVTAVTELHRAAYRALPRELHPLI